MDDVQFGIGPRKLLQGMLGQNVEADLINNALEQCDQYQLKTIPKKSGGLRSLYVPPPDLKQLQKLILKRFFYRFMNKLSVTAHGFLPKRSILTHANSHKDKQWKHVIRLDLKDAFPSVKSETIRAIFREYLLPELADYTKQYRERKRYPKKWFKWIYHKHPIFPARRVRWFRRLIINHPGSELPLDIAERFIDHLVLLTTFQGRLPQGAPTSPFLLNLVFSYFKIPKNISGELNDSGFEHIFTVYADDMVISSKKEIPPEVVEKLITIIEASGVFTVNRKKTIRFDRRQIDPLITGLRVVKRFSPRNRRTMDRISFPKNKIRAIRSLIHHATINPSAERDKKVQGYIAFLQGIYLGPHSASQRRDIKYLPPAILKPYRKYLEYLDSVKCQNLNTNP